MHSQIFRVGLLTLALHAPCAVRAQVITITPVALSVTDPTGAPIAQANILVSIGLQMASDTTDEHGQAFLHLQTGNYRITVYKPGYESGTVHITVTPVENSADKNVTVVLQPDSFVWATPTDPTNKGSSFNANSKLIRMANGTTKDGFVYSENLYLGPDGEEVYFKIIHYHSTDRVKKEFEAGLNDSVKVIDHRKATDKNGQIKSEMVVITRAKADQKIVALILIASDENLRTVCSHSLKDVLAVAKDLKPLEP